MTRWQAYRAVAAGLRPVAGLPARLDPDPDWTLIVAAASHHLVTPALGWSLLAAGSVQGETARYFEAVLDLNRARNRVLLAALERALEALDAAGIRPALLKGAAFLAEAAYPDPGARVLGDLDLLVPEPELAAAAAALDRAGFGPPRTELPTPAGHHHLPPQTDPASGVTIELHRAPTERRYGRIVGSPGCFAAGSAIVFRGRGAILPSPTDRVAHNIVHGQLSDRNHRRGIPDLRQMLDLAVLRAHHESEIDWADLAARFRAAGFGPVLADTLACLDFLLGQPPPGGIEPGPRAVERMARAIERPAGARARAAWLWTLGDALAAFRDDPRRLVAALRRGAWRRMGRAREW